MPCKQFWAWSLSYRKFGTVILNSKIKKELGEVFQAKGTAIAQKGQKSLAWFRIWQKSGMTRAHRVSSGSRKTSWGDLHYFQEIGLLPLLCVPTLFGFCDPNQSPMNNLRWFHPLVAFLHYFYCIFQFFSTQDLCICCALLLNCDFLEESFLNAGKRR